MNKILIFSLIAVTVALSSAQYSYAQTPGIHFDSSLGLFGNPDFAIIDRGVTIADYDRFKSVIDETGRTFVIGGNHPIVAHSSVETPDIVRNGETFHFVARTDGSLPDIAAFSTDYFSSILPDGKDEGGAPSRSGIGTFENHRVSFGCATNVVFLMSNTEIFIQNGRATCESVEVYFDNQLIDRIPVTLNDREPWIGIGGSIIKIPFEAYYHITPEGRLIHLGDGYQHISRDLNNVETQIDSDED